MKQKNPTIFYFTHFNPSAPCVRYRGKYLIENLSSNNKVSFQFIYPKYSVKMIVRFIISVFLVLISNSNIMICQKIYRKGLYASILLFLIRYTKNISIYDIDDAYFVNHEEEIINQFISKSDKVIVGSTSLLNYSKKFNENVVRIPSCILKQNQEDKNLPKTPTIGFTGSVNYYLPILMKQVFPAIKQIKSPIRLVILGINRSHQKEVIHNYFKNIKNIELITPEINNWEDEELVYSWIKTFTYGLAPLSDTVIDQSKSAFKMKQYFTCGVPCIGSDIGENGMVIKNRINGIICNSQEEYQLAFSELEKLNTLDYKSLRLHSYESAKVYSYDNFVNDYWASIKPLLN